MNAYVHGIKLKRELKRNPNLACERQTKQSKIETTTQRCKKEQDRGILK